MTTNHDPDVLLNEAQAAQFLGTQNQFRNSPYLGINLRGDGPNRGISFRNSPYSGTSITSDQGGAA